MNPIIRLPHAKSFLLASASALALTIAAPGAAFAFGPLSEHVIAGGATGPAPNPTSPIPGLPIAVSTQAQAQAAQAQTTANLATAAARLQAALTAQANARNAAIAGPNNLGANLPNVPDGLAAGGLNPDSGLAANGKANPVITWVGANTPTQTAANGQTNVTVTQTQQAAILNWQTFNVGKKTTVNFVQKDATGADQTSWVALNKVNDPAALPSQILGQINAPGSVYVVNRNGVIFGGSSQVNVHSLVAAATDFDNGQFLNNGIYSTQTNSAYNPSFSNAGGNITVQAGAQINTAAPFSVTSGGGQVLLLGQNVENDGQISTPIGQTILAAGDNFILRPGYSTDGSNPLSTTNGSEIAVVEPSNGTWVPGGTGVATNAGTITAQQGDITLAGHTINQAGVLLSTTSVATRGTIHLLNSVSDVSGAVTMGSGSLTDVMPELDTTDTALNAQRAGLGVQPTRGLNPAASAQFDNLSLPWDDLRYESRIDVVTGGTVEFQNASLTLANAGQINILAQKRAQVDKGAMLDVSGVNVSAPVSENVLTVNVQGNEERDDPNNRDKGALFNDDVYVDDRNLILVPGDPNDPNGYPTDRYYTPGGLLEVSGELANQGHTEGEWAASGGTIGIATASAGAIIIQSGSNINLEGGSIAYSGGRVPTTWLKASDGSIVNINQASANQTYTGLANSFQVDHTRWVVSDNFSSGLLGGSSIYEPGYVVGRDAGSLTINSPTALFNGTIDASVVSGTQQTAGRPTTAIDPFLESQTTIPIAASLVFGPTQVPPGPNFFPVYANTNVEVGSGTQVGDALTLNDAVPENVLGTTLLDAAALSAMDLGGIGINTTNHIAINKPLTLADGGQLTLNGYNTDLNANITVHSGSVAVYNANPSVGALTLEPNITIDTTGLWINAELDPNDFAGSAFINGGSVTLLSTGDLILEHGSLIDASSGAEIMPNGIEVGGAGGNITLSSNAAPPNLLQPQLNADSLGLRLDGTLRSYGVTKGGALTIQGNAIIIGNDNLVNGTLLPAGQASPGDLTLAATTIIPAGSILSSATLAGSWVSLAAGQVTPVAISFQSSTVGPGGALQVATQTLLGSGNSVTTAAPWVVPAGAGNVTTQSGGSFTVGQTIPAGAVIIGISGTLPAGAIIPADVFPNGLPVPEYTVNIAAGSTIAQALAVPGFYWPTHTPLPAPVTIAAGSIIHTGEIADIDLHVVTPTELDPAFFQQGFSAYTVDGIRSVTVTDGTDIEPIMPVMRFTNASRSIQSSENAESALLLWQPPLYLTDPSHATVAQRGGVSLTLATVPSTISSLSPLWEQLPGWLSIGAGSKISVDPGQSINLASYQQADVEGTLNAPGGSISVLGSTSEANGTASLFFGAYPAGYNPAQSIWIGDTATLNVAADAFTAVDQFGRSFGIVPNGGTITLGSKSSARDSRGFLSSDYSSVIVRPGAVLDASGTSATLDLAAGLGMKAPSDPVLVASDGGSIAMSSYNGFYIDGTIRAFAGGDGASGGSLSLVLEAPPNPVAALTQNAELQARILTVVQNQTPSGISNNTGPGSSDPALLLGTGMISVQQIESGGFGSVLLHGGDVTVFKGDVSLSLSKSLTIEDGTIGLDPTTASANVSLSAPYVLLTGNIGIGQNFNVGTSYLADTPTSLAGTGTLTINANLIDIEDPVTFGNHTNITEVNGPSVNVDYPSFSDVKLISQGDIRFLQADNPSAGNFFNQFTSLTNSTGDIDFTAARIYPATGVTAYVIANSITIGRIGSGDVAAPDSAFGNLYLFGVNITQGGVLQAPLGRIVLGGNDPAVLQPLNFNNTFTGDGTENVTFLPGSETSTSAAGLTMPYGGTADGINYYYDGSQISFPSDFFATEGVLVGAASVDIEQGALLDLSGGGTLSGAGFVSGRGGSIDVLRNPLVVQNPANTFSSAANQVYAIFPSYKGSYAPVMPDADGNPAIGQQITVGSNVPGLPAGTYTLLPSTYATLPGAYRVEIGTSSTKSVASGILPDGTVHTVGKLSTAGTDIASTLETQILVTSGSVLRTYSEYNETDYDDFARAQAAQLGTPLPRLLEDAGSLTLDYSAGAMTPLIARGTVDLSAATDGTNAGHAGTVFITGAGFAGITTPIEVRTADQLPTAGTLSFVDADLNDLGGGALIVGGLEGGYRDGPSPGGGSSNIISYYSTTGGVTVNSGVILSAAQIFLPGTSTSPVNIQSGATLSTLGKGAATWDSDSDDVLLEFGGVGLSNGSIIITPVDAAGHVASGATLLSEGTVVLAGGNSFNVDPAPIIGTKNLIIGGDTVNIGSADSLASASAANILPVGWSLNQDVLNNLLSPTIVGAPALQQLTLIGSNSINFVGSVDLNTIDPVTGKARVSLAMQTPALYGLGAGGDIASLTTDVFTWSDVVGLPNAALNGAPAVASPSAVTAGGPGTGSGQLVINANQIVFGFPVQSTPDALVSIDRLALGFSNVILNSVQEITANNTGTLSVYQSGSDPSQGFSPAIYIGSGGNLALNTPLLTTEAGAKMGFFTAGALSVVAPVSGGEAPGKVTALGGEIDLTGGAVTLNTAIALPSGKLDVLAANDIVLGSSAAIDLSGRAVGIFDQTEYSWGGNASFESTSGNISQSAGSVINVSAINNTAGSVSFTAVNDAPAEGDVSLAGQFLGASTGGYLAGGIDVRANTLDGFADLNSRLDAGGVYGSRGFSIDTGDLTIQDLKAHDIEISINGGSLTIDGTLDASGATPGTIRLSAIDNLTLSSSAVLDAHGTVLQTDSYGMPIASENQAFVELTSSRGVLALNPDATIDMRVTDPRNLDAAGNQIVNYGDLELNASRTCETCGDILVSAPGSLNIMGAATIALNGFWNYSPSDPNGTIVQDNGGSTGVGSNLIATATTTLETFDTATTVSLATTVTFKGLPANAANTAIGEYQTANFFMLPGYCGTYCGLATVVSGQVINNQNHFTFNPGDQIGRFNINPTGQGTTFAPGTEIDVAGVPVGTVLFTDGTTVVKSGIPIATPVSTSTAHSASGAPGTATSSVTNPDGSITITQVTTTEVDTILSRATTSVADGTPLGSSTTSTVGPDGTTVTAADVSENADAGFVGLNQIDAQNRLFINAATANDALKSKVAGLTGYTDAFHLRPGVEIDSAASTGDLNTLGDLDFSGFRYSSLNPNSQQTSVYGSGEPGSVVFRAGGNLNVNGSVSDGFGSAVLADVGTRSLGQEPVVFNDVPVTTKVTFSLLPVPDSSLGQHIVGHKYFYFGNYAPTVEAGEVINQRGVVFGVGQTITYFGAGTVIEPNTVLSFPNVANAATVLSAQNLLYASELVPAASAMLPAGSLSWNMRFVSGADLKAADTRMVQAKSALDATAVPAHIGSQAFGNSVGFVNGFTFSNLPTPDVASGQSYSGPFFYFPGYFDHNPTEEPIIASGGIQDPNQGLLGPGTRVGYFTQGATFLPGTILTFPVTGQSFDGVSAQNINVTVPIPAAPAKGSITLFDARAAATTIPIFSVVRTGTGNLDLIAGENFQEKSLYGVYTAGTQSSGIDPAYELSRSADPGLETAAPYQAYYPISGGNVLVKAQADVTGFYHGDVEPNSGDHEYSASDAIGNWLWRQGGDGESTAWWINFGAFANLKADNGADISVFDSGLGISAPLTELVGFDGIGTLGGGNLTVKAGGDAGVLTGGGVTASNTTALDLFVASTGRVAPDGTLTQTGGGTLTLDVGGGLNPQTTYPTTLADGGSESWGVIGDLRGDITVNAGSIGHIYPDYVTKSANDPRAQDPFTATNFYNSGGPLLAPGDSTVTLQTRGDLVVADVVDPGRVPLQNEAVNGAGDLVLSSFTLWRPSTAVNLVSAGSDIIPENIAYDSGGSPQDFAIDGMLTEDDGKFLYPPILNVIAESGSIYYGTNLDVGKSVIELAPSPVGALNFIAADSIIGGIDASTPIAWTLSGSSPSLEATPFNPGYVATTTDQDIITNNWGGLAASDIYERGVGPGYLSLYNFGLDTITSNLRDADAPPARFYAGSGDIYDLRYGDITKERFGGQTTSYVSGAPVLVEAGRDIVNFGAPFGVPLFTNGYFGGQGTGSFDITSLIVNLNPSDVSLLSAGRDILYANAVVAGPGDLEVVAGRNIYQGDHGLLESIGPVFGAADNSARAGGATISLLAGVGAGGPDLTDFAELYLNSANQADPNFPLDFPQNQGKVVQTYEDQLYAWLQQRFGYAGKEAGALAYFLSLPSDQQLLFDQKVYFDELDASDMEFNNPSSRRYQSYVRGKQAIAELFPSQDYSGSVTLASGDESIYIAGTPIIWDAGIHTEFGGDINVLTPGGTATLGSEGIIPGASTGLLTEGSGNINVYAEGSIPLGLSRVFTTFGGDITMWSATGDINAGRGAKGTVVFTPVRRTYDQFGNVALAPTVPSQGAGIATLAPIPGIPPGDVFLVAPEGIIDAGEAGIRVSGNAFLAALQVVNAANIQVKGQAFGLPPKPVTNLSFTAASTAATEAAQIVRQMGAQARFDISVEVTGFGGDPDQPAECMPGAGEKCRPSR